MDNGHFCDEISVALYLTPPSPSDDQPVDPMVELELMEREEAERLAKLADNKPADHQPMEGITTPDGRDDTQHVDAEEHEDGLEADGGGISGDSSSSDASSEETDVSTEDVQSVTDSEDVATTATPSPDVSMEDTEDQDQDSDDAVSGSADQQQSYAGTHHQPDDADDTDDEDEQGFAVVWSGHAPQWVRDAGADAADALLVHACNCAAPRRCDDPRFGELCLPMKRLLRCACWASHSDTWLAGGVAARVAGLLGYHSLHCEAGACGVPLCAALART